MKKIILPISCMIETDELYIRKKLDLEGFDLNREIIKETDLFNHCDIYTQDEEVFD